MNYDLHVTNINSGKSKIRQMRGEICFGRAKGSTLFSAGDVVTAITYYFQDPQEVGVWKEIVRTLRLGDKLSVNLPAEGDQSVTLQVADMDRADAMRNLFIIRTLGGYSARKYKQLRKAGLTPRQSVLICTVVLFESALRNPYWNTGGSSGLSPRFNTKKDYKRFLRNPQDARGFRGGLFKDNPGKGYTTGNQGVGIISSFATYEINPKDSMWLSSQLGSKEAFINMIKDITGVQVKL